MKKYILLCLICVVSAFVSGCEEIKGEINELKVEINELKEADKKIQQQIDLLNSTVSNIQTIIAAIQSGAYIKSVMPLVEEGQEVGYVFTLSNGETFSVRNGKDGKDGVVPAISILCDEHNNFWWTLNGEIITDSNGNKVKADGIVPKFKIVDGVWNVSFDNGQTWKELGPANGEDGMDGMDGDQLFSDIVYVEGGNVVKFILADQTVLTLPCYQAISISFDIPDNQAGIHAGETIKVNYSLSYGDSNTVVTASTDGNYIAQVIKSSDISGTILITCPGLYMDGYVNVMAFDGVGYSSVAVIRFFEKEIIFESGLNFYVNTDAGRISVPFLYNFEYYVEVDKGASGWLTLEKTKAGYESGEIVANYSQNNGAERTGIIYIYPTNTAGEPYAKITVTQKEAYFNISDRSALFTSNGGEKSIGYSSSRNTIIETSSDWISTSLHKAENHYHILNIFVTENKTANNRTGKINILAEDNRDKLATIDIIQLAEGGESEMDLVFEVRVNEANDYTAYLPIGRMGNSDFIISWGDGQYQKVDEDYNLRYSVHQYDSSQGARNYEVRVSGTVEEINSGYIYESDRSSIIAIKQWGNIGLRYISSGFERNLNLESIAPDDSYCFSNITDFICTFSHCPKLKTISEKLFQNAKSADRFIETFYDCKSLEDIPSGLFADCSSVRDFSNVFNSCTSIKVIPEDLFKGCSNVTSFYGAFWQCSNLTSIPEDLFKDTKKVESFHGTFCECWNLSSIPDGLFRNTVSARNFSETFRDCDISTIPANLFKACKDAAYFSCTFLGCDKLISIPSDLFDNNRKVTDFHATFGWCGWECLEGESPYTMIDGKKIHLYEREYYPDYFVTPISNGQCFYTDWNLSDIENIPSSWKD